MGSSRHDEDNQEKKGEREKATKKKKEHDVSGICGPLSVITVLVLVVRNVAAIAPGPLSPPGSTPTILDSSLREQLLRLLTRFFHRR
jgi:hypothetical protein